MVGRRLITLGALLALVTCSTGCADLLHNLQLHRLAHWNRGKELGGGDDAYSFSISDPIPNQDELDFNENDPLESDDHNMQLHRPAHWDKAEELGGRDDPYSSSISDPIPNFVDLDVIVHE